MGEVVALRKHTELEFGGGDEDDNAIVCPECDNETFVMFEVEEGVAILACENCGLELVDIEIDVED